MYRFKKKKQLKLGYSLRELMSSEKVEIKEKGYAQIFNL